VDLFRLLLMLKRCRLDSRRAALAVGSQTCSHSWFAAPDTTQVAAERGVAQVVEVKGPTDHLSQQQRAWLRRLRDNDIDAFVVNVLPPGQKKRRR
jgi:hypothetical protein